MNNLLKSPVFQMYECQNPDCGLRMPTNLSVGMVETCPFCKFGMKPVGPPFQNTFPLRDDKPSNQLIIHILLDNLRSVFNVGAVFRTANGSAVEHIYCCGTTPTPEHPKFIKSGLGADETIPWTYARNGVDIVKSAITNKFKVISLEISNNSHSIFGFFQHTTLQDKVLLVVGNEVSGIDPGILELSDYRIHIPMLGIKTSLNVSIAAALAMYTLRFMPVSTRELKNH